MSLYESCKFCMNLNFFPLLQMYKSALCVLGSSIWSLLHHVLCIIDWHWPIKVLLLSKPCCYSSMSGANVNEKQENACLVDKEALKLDH